MEEVVQEEVDLVCHQAYELEKVVRMGEEENLKKVNHSGLRGYSRRVRMLGLVVMGILKDQELEILEEDKVTTVVKEVWVVAWATAEVVKVEKVEWVNQAKAEETKAEVATATMMAVKPTVHRTWHKLKPVELKEKAKTLNVTEAILTNQEIIGMVEVEVTVEMEILHGNQTTTVATEAIVALPVVEEVAAATAQVPAPADTHLAGAHLHA